MIKFRWMCLFVFGVRLAGAAAQQESAPVMAFADDLYRRGDYYRAITEYERFIFLSPEVKQAARARFQVGMCYVRGGKWEAARDQFVSLKERDRTSPEGRDAQLMLAHVYYRLQKYTMAGEVVDEFILIHDLPCHRIFL